MDKGCSGACGQGRNTCPTPFACEISEEMENEVLKKIVGILVCIGLIVFCFGVIVWL
jgi:hypothetical protein